MSNNEDLCYFLEENILNIEKVIEKYNNYIYYILKNAITCDEDIEEILSDVFVVLWKNYKQLDKHTNIKAYLVGITKNLIKKKYRDYNTQYVTDYIEDLENQISSQIDIEELAQMNEKSKIISNILEKMKKEEKEIFIMFYYKSKKIKEIAKSLNISEPKVKVKLYRIRKLIKKKFKERGYNYGK